MLPMKKTAAMPEVSKAPQGWRTPKTGTLSQRFRNLRSVLESLPAKNPVTVRSSGFDPSAGNSTAKRPWLDSERACTSSQDRVSV